MMHVFETHPPVQTDGQVPENVGSAAHCEHVPAWQVAGAVHFVPHPPQLPLSVCSLTHAPLHGLKPLLQVNVHAPLLQAAVAFATLVVQAAGEPQAPLALQVSTALPEHVV
jgi:hypothetical protein